MRPLKVAQIESGMALIDEGLKPGERIVVDGQYKLQPGSHVKPAEPAPGAQKDDRKDSDGKTHRGEAKPRAALGPLQPISELRLAHLSPLPRMCLAYSTDLSLSPRGTSGEREKTQQCNAKHILTPEAKESLSPRFADANITVLSDNSSDEVKIGGEDTGDFQTIPGPALQVPARGESICLARDGRWVCSADFQSAVSPNCIRQGVGWVPRVGFSRRLAECNSAIQQSTTLRYDRALNIYAGEVQGKGEPFCHYRGETGNSHDFLA